MDIEGAELPALKGAKNTIINDRPILMVSAYHKRDDVFKIYQFVNSIAEDYKFFFRCHRPNPTDDVLYAVPSEKVI